MSIIPRRKIQTRKFVPRNEFRYNHSPTAEDHPQYIFGKKGNKYKSLPLTTTRPENVPYYELTKNPNPYDKSASYLPLVKPQTARISYYDKKPLKGWSFAKEDMPIVRHRIKTYKKSYNQKPFMWYENKKKK